MSNGNPLGGTIDDKGFFFVIVYRENDIVA